ncbi:MAG: redoxin family protein [Bacteroidota bacterium]
MKTRLFSIVVLSIVALAFSAMTPISTLNIGDKAPMTDYKMVSTDKQELSLDDLKGENGLLAIFTCNTCPFVIAWEHRYPNLAKIAESTGIGIVLINPNEAKRQGADSLEEMIKHGEEADYGDIPYVVDANHQLADAFGATKTPDVFLFNNVEDELVLAYKGAMDNSGGRGEMTDDFLSRAIRAMVTGKQIDPETTKAIGCSIKRL